ncbi:MAG TPA: hypothetical protein VN812_07725 [Candidatus Acidoferrales bacterium]|nr:hypothetical protein [Candidatus Acidoferrales bacterium]
MASPIETDRLSGRVLRLVPTGKRLAVDKVELLLAEKQTALALLRSSIAVLALPLCVITVLLVTSSYYHFERVLVLALLPLGLCAGLIGLGISLLVRALRELHRLDQRIEAIKQQSGPFADAIL